MADTLTTAATKLLRIRSPVLLAGMGPVSGHEIAAAVTNAGGLGVLGAHPDLRGEIRMMKELITGDKTCFGVDLLLPQIGGGARKTNHDYNGGQLDKLVDIMCEEGCRLFVCAVGVPPKWVVDRLHASGCLVMNMAGHPKHVDKACEVGVDFICAQGTEAGGHTGSIATMALVPQCIDRCKGRTSPHTGEPVHVIAAGGIYDGRTVAAALALGAEGVWVGTRFLACEEAAATKIHKQQVVNATSPDQMVQSLHFSGRPCRMFNTEYTKEWNGPRAKERDALIEQGHVPLEVDAWRAENKKKMPSNAKVSPDFRMSLTQPLFMGQVSSAITEILPAAKIMEELVGGAAKILKARAGIVSSKL